MLILKAPCKQWSLEYIYQCFHNINFQESNNLYRCYFCNVGNIHVVKVQSFAKFTTNYIQYYSPSPASSWNVPPLSTFSSELTCSWWILSEKNGFISKRCRLRWPRRAMKWTIFVLFSKLHSPFLSWNYICHFSIKLHSPLSMNLHLPHLFANYTCQPVSPRITLVQA